MFRSKSNKGYKNPIADTRRNIDKSPQEMFVELVRKFYESSPYTKNVTLNQELEVKFGTRNIKPITKIDYDNVIRKLKSLGFTSANEQGEYLLRVQHEFMDIKTGQFRESTERNIRTEIEGFRAIQDYCKHNSLRELKQSSEHLYAVSFVKKSGVKANGLAGADSYLPSVNFDDFNFRVSYQTEQLWISSASPIIKELIDNWEKSKKTFRYINRVTFQHPDLPIKIDISIVKSSKKEEGSYRLQKTYTTEESGVFTNPEIFEIELEVDNSKIGPATSYNSPESILDSLRKGIKYVLMGLQGTNFPISYPEQQDVLRSYMKLLHGEKYNPDRRVYPKDFLGPSSYTLQMQNISPIDENVNVPNIRRNYVVTDKADGDRHLMYVSPSGKIYLINTNMNVVFTGAVTEEKSLFDSLFDGELVLHNKNTQFINLFAVFDVYYIAKEDVRGLSFMPLTEEEKDKEREKERNREKPKMHDSTKQTSRHAILQSAIKKISPSCVVKGQLCPIRVETKKFYPEKMSSSQDMQTDIFQGCKTVLSKVKNGLFEYNTDGLIFTPAYMGVGGDKIGATGKLGKTTWEYSFKWKPAEYNTIDFFVTTKKTPNSSDDIITPVFEDGIYNGANGSALSQFKTLILRVGFSERDHGFLNPCQDLLEDNLPEYGEGSSADGKGRDNENNYKPVQFYPTNPYDVNAGVCHIMLKEDDTGVLQMFTEEGEVFEDNTIVEFKYDMSREGAWRWVPLRVRYDKTAELKQGISKNFGNAYHVANSNWTSIHNPITSEMIGNGSNIPEWSADEDVYYNRQSSSTQTMAMRNFHNLYVKQLLIKSVSNRGDILIDYACGKGGDFSKWIKAQLSFVFGIDISKDNLENRLDGACARFLRNRKEYKKIPYALFVNGNSSKNIRSGAAMLNDKAIKITKAVFGEIGKEEASRIGKAVERQYGKAEDGFNVSSCQFALHYFFENIDTLRNFARNVSECTRLGGYFIATAYDGKLIFNMLKGKERGDGVSILGEGGVKIWEVKKEYGKQEMDDDASCLGYKIDVFQESINKLIPEYLVNYDYLNRVMEDFGFKLINRDEAHSLGVPEGSGLFSDLYMNMMDEIKKNKYKMKEYGDAVNMNAYDKKISFLNRYVVYKKIRIVNTAKVVLEEVEAEIEEEKMEKEEEDIDIDFMSKNVKKDKKTKRESSTKTTKTKSKVKKLTGTLVLEEDVVDGPKKEEEMGEKEKEKERKQKEEEEKEEEKKKREKDEKEEEKKEEEKKERDKKQKEEEEKKKKEEEKKERDKKQKEEEEKKKKEEEKKEEDKKKGTRERKKREKIEIVD